MKVINREFINSKFKGFYLFKVIFNESQQPVDAICLDENKAAVKIFGQAMKGKLISEVNPGIEPQWLELYGTVARTGVSMRRELYAAAFERWYSIYVFLRGDIGGNKIGVLFKDITDYKRYEEMQWICRERNLLALEVLHAVVYDYDVITGRFNHLDGLEYLTGHDLPAEPTILWWDQLIHPDDLPGCRAALADSIDSGSEFRVQHRIRHRDGYYIYVEGFNRPFCDESGRVVRIIGITIDISLYKKLERELEQLVGERTAQLKRSERKYRLIVDNMPDIVCFYDKELRYLYRNNPSDGTFIPCGGQIVGKTWGELGVDKALWVPWQEKFELARKTRQKVEFEVAFPKMNGDLRDYFSRVIPILDDEGEIETFLEISADITERKKMETELLRFDRLNTVGEMAAAIAHEVRNPLTTVRGYLQMFLRKNESDKYRDHFETMIEELDRANGIISDFLSLAKNKAVEFENCNLRDLILSLFPLLQAEAYRTGNDIQVFLEDVPDTMMDKKEIRQMILNLVRNGFEAMNGGGVLKIKTYMENGHTVLAVADTGQGIPKYLLNKLGKPFLTTKEGGTGLGLPVCYRVAERHGANIDINTSPQGTTFSIHFGSIGRNIIQAQLFE